VDNVWFVASPWMGLVLLASLTPAAVPSASATDFRPRPAVADE
jgi:hypothetical protein